MDFEQKQVHIGADGLSKNGESRAVDFNSKLEMHLRDMATRRAPDSVRMTANPEVSRQMEVVKDVMHRYRNTLRELAK